MSLDGFHADTNNPLTSSLITHDNDTREYVLDPRYKLLEEASIANGAVLENVTVGQGQYGMTVLAIDPSKAIKIHLPESLLLPSEAVDFSTNTVKADVEVTDAIREYWNLYLDTVFGPEALANRRAVEQAISKENLHEWQEEEQIAILQRFLEVSENDSVLRQKLSSARVLSRQGNHFHMPYLDWVNHRHPSLGFAASKNGVKIEGEAFDGEVFVSYGMHDAMKLLNTYGFFNETSFAYAIPTSFKLSEELTLAVSNNNLDPFSFKNHILVPKIVRKDNVILADFCLLGNKGRPRAPRMSWRTGVNESVGLDSKTKQQMMALYTGIQRRTWQSLWKIYRRGEQVENEALRNLMMSAARDTFRNSL